MTENETAQSGKNPHPLRLEPNQYDEMRDHLGDMYVHYTMSAKNIEQAMAFYQTVLYLDKLLTALAGDTMPASEIKEVAHE